MCKELKTYKVCAKCGHVGRGRYIESVFPIRAESPKEAAAKVREFPRVKHHHKDAIIYVREITEEQFNELVHINSKNPYMKCKNIQEQRKNCELEIKEEKNESNKKQKEVNKRKMYCHKKEIRNQKKYFLRYANR